MCLHGCVCFGGAPEESVLNCRGMLRRPPYCDGECITALHATCICRGCSSASRAGGARVKRSWHLHEYMRFQLKTRKHWTIDVSRLISFTILSYKNHVHTLYQWFPTSCACCCTSAVAREYMESSSTTLKKNVINDLLYIHMLRPHPNN